MLKSYYNYVLDEILGVHEAETNFRQQKHKVVLPYFGIRVDPLHQNVPDILLTLYIQLIVFDYLPELVSHEFHEFVALFCDDRELFDDIFVRSFHQRPKVIITARRIKHVRSQQNYSLFTKNVK